MEPLEEVKEEASTDKDLSSEEILAPASVGSSSEEISAPTTNEALSSEEDISSQVMDIENEDHG
jgi:hypothetical protein